MIKTRQVIARKVKLKTKAVVILHTKIVIITISTYWYKKLALVFGVM